MPRKQNGFGSFRVKGVDKVGKPKKAGAAGIYPRNRRYGSAITRTIIEDWDASSAWVRWRKGMEYYFQAAYLVWQEATAVLFQGTESEIDVTFDGYRFATKNADSRTHYAIRRRMDQNRQLAFVDSVLSDPVEFAENKLNHELWIKTASNRQLNSDTLLLRSIGERITDGITAANIKNILTSEKKPAVYHGKSFRDGVTLEVTATLSEIEASPFVQENGLEALIGEILYLPDFYQVVNLGLDDVFSDYKEHFTVEMSTFENKGNLQILESDSTLPPTLGDIENLTPIYKTQSSSNEINGEFIFRKSDYQRFFGIQYLTADLVRQHVDRASFAVMPQKILGYKRDPSTDSLIMISEPFQATLTLYTPNENERYVILDDRGFTKQYPDYKDGVYQHQPEKPGVPDWQTLQLNIDPWMDQTFLVGNSLSFADLYTCSCPDYLHAKIRSPETFDSEGNKLNRQTRLPMPTAQSPSDFSSAGLLNTAGISESWASDDYKKSFKICKHTIASMFINKIRVQEPSQIPSVESRETFEGKLQLDIQEVAAEFDEMLKRSEVTTVEIVYALAEALNLDDVEIGYVLLTASF